MLDEQELAARPQHPAQLPQRPRLIVHAAQHQRRHGHIERTVIERKILGWRAQDRDVPGVPAGLVLQAAQLRGLGLGHRE
jgi:hypothetical protein